MCHGRESGRRQEKAKGKHQAIPDEHQKHLGSKQEGKERSRGVGGAGKGGENVLS